MKKPNSAMQAILDAHASLGPLPIETLTHEQARLVPLLDRAAAAYYGQHFTKRALTPNPLPVGKVENILIDGAEGKINARVYTPDEEAPADGFPVLLYFHGGGWVLGTLDTYDASCRALCDGAGCVVVAVQYRLAPEHPWPAAPKDAFAAYQWLRLHARDYRANPDLIAVAGESAGGNLATVTCMQARDEGVPLPLHQLLVYPVTDVAQGMRSPSAMEFANEKPLNTPMLGWFYAHYTKNVGDHTNPYLSPLHGDVTGLPDATIILAEIDPLFSEGEAYAEKLAHAGVSVGLASYEGVCHEFFGLAGLVSDATEAMNYACTQLREAFERGSINLYASRDPATLRSNYFNDAL